MKEIIRIVAIMVVCYCAYSINLVNDFKNANSELHNSSTNLFDTIFSFENIDSQKYEENAEIAVKDYVEKNINFFDSLFNLRSLPTLWVGIFIGLCFIFDPTAHYLREFIKNFFEIIF